MPPRCRCRGEGSAGGGAGQAAAGCLRGGPRGIIEDAQTREVPMGRALFLIALSSLAFAPLPARKPKADPNAQALKELQGEWVVTSRNRGPTAGMTAVINGDRMTFLLGGEVRTEWVIVLDV